MAYVNRENLIQLLAHENSNIEAGRQYYSAIYQKVMNMPTADVAEVKWIDVNERSPQKNVRVLVYLKENACDYTRVDTDRRIDDGQWVRWGNNVAHWMPLPEPPSGAKMDGGKEE